MAATLIIVLGLATTLGLIVWLNWGESAREAERKRLGQELSDEDLSWP